MEFAIWDRRKINRQDLILFILFINEYVYI